MGLKHWFRLVWFTIVDAVMWPARRSRLRKVEERAHEIALARIQAEVQAEGLRGMTSAMQKVVEEMASVAREQNAVLKTWLEGFRAITPPSSTIVREEDEVRAERDRLLGMGFPVDADGVTQLQWIHSEIDSDIR